MFARLSVLTIITLSNCNLIAVDLSKHKELDADSRAVQLIDFYGILRTNSQ